MSQLVLFDLSHTASARSQGQARRRQFPKLSDEERRNARNEGRRRRARQRKGESFTSGEADRTNITKDTLKVQVVAPGQVDVRVRSNLFNDLQTPGSDRCHPVKVKVLGTRVLNSSLSTTITESLSSPMSGNGIDISRFNQIGPRQSESLVSADLDSNSDEYHALSSIMEYRDVWSLSHKFSGANFSDVVPSSKSNEFEMDQVEFECLICKLLDKQHVSSSSSEFTDHRMQHWYEFHKWRTQPCPACSHFYDHEDGHLTHWSTFDNCKLARYH